MSGNPLVSVIVCIYNAEEYLQQCVESLLGQTYTNLEIVLIDDGSTDSSASIIDEFALHHEQVKSVHQVNLGFGGARNTGLDNAHGDFLAFVDSDDFVEPDYVSYLLQVQRLTQSDIAISKNCFTSSNEVQISEDQIETLSAQQATSEFFYPEIRLGSWNKLYKRDFLDHYDLRFMPELSTGEGLQFITKAASLAKRVGVGKRKVYHYRLDNPTSATTKADVERQGIGSLNTINFIMNDLSSHSDTVKQAMCWHLWSCYGYCLRQIIASGQKRQYSNLYRKCVRELRFGGPSAFMAPVPLRSKIAALGNMVSPQLVALASLRQKRNLVKGNYEENS